LDYLLLFFIILVLGFTAFFSGTEIAFISVHKLHFELMGKRGTLAGRILSHFSKKPSLFIGATLIGNTVSIVIYGILMADALEPYLDSHLPAVIHNEWMILIIQTICSTLLVVATAEFLPKIIFLKNPEKILTYLAIPLFLIYILLYPFVFIIISLTKLVIVRIARFSYSEDKPVFGLTDLNHYIKSRLQRKNEEEEIALNTRIFHNALEFKKLKARDCMVHRTELRAIDLNDSVDDLKKEFIESGHSKILIYKQSIDDIVGYCHSLDLFKNPEHIKNILTPIPIVPESMHAQDLMLNLITERKSMALVVDEFGGTSGIITMEDVMEEIFGEIKDEHDEENKLEEKIDDHTYILSAQLDIDYLNEKYGWSIPEGEYETLGGYILSIAEDIPDINETIYIPPFHFTIISKEDSKIETVKIIRGENEDLLEE